MIDIMTKRKLVLYCILLRTSVAHWNIC